MLCQQRMSVMCTYRARHGSTLTTRFCRCIMWVHFGYKLRNLPGILFSVTRDPILENIKNAHPRPRLLIVLILLSVSGHGRIMPGVSFTLKGHGGYIGPVSALILGHGAQRIYIVLTGAKVNVPVPHAYQILYLSRR